MQSLGFVRYTALDCEAGRACMEFEAKQGQCHSGDIVQGGFITAWIDNAMATAAMARTNFERVAMSLDIKVAFYRAAHPGLVVAEGWVERMGSRTAFTEGQLRTPEGEIIAKAMSTVTMVPRRG
jgi:uncharacterized protein (TIGR00369 family)